MMGAGEVKRFFQESFGVPPARMVRAPGRLELLGNHTDYNGGLVMSIAVDKYVYMASSPRKDGEVQQKPEKPAGTPIYPMEHLPEAVQQNAVRMAILTVPAAAAQEVANQLIDAGISGILNFAPIVLHVPDEVTVNNVNLAIELENLSYFIQQ